MHKAKRILVLLMALIFCSVLVMPVGVSATGDQSGPMMSPESPGPTITIRILYVRNNADKTVLAAPYIATVPVGYEKTVDVTSPTITGFVPDQQQVSLDFSHFTQDTDLEVVYSPKTVDYTVDHQVESLDRNSYERYQLETKQAQVEDELVAQPLEIAGFSPQKPFESAKVPAEGTLNLQIKYSRNAYKLSYNTDGGSYIASEQKLYEADLTEPTPPTKAGYSFAGWEPAFPARMPAQDLELKAKWVEGEETPYRFAYYIQNADDDDYTFLGTVAKVGKTDSKITIPADGEGPANCKLFPLNQAYASQAWYFNKYFVFNQAKTDAENGVKIIAADGQTTVNLYFDRQVYTLLMGSQPDQFETPGWYPEFTRDGKTYERPEVLAVKARFGQDITKLVPTDAEVSNPEGRRITGMRVWEKSGRFWYFPDNPPYRLTEIHCWFPQKVLTSGEYAGDPFALWMFISFEKVEQITGRQVSNLTLREHFQDIKGEYTSGPKTRENLALGYTSWFCEPGDYTGFSADESEMMYLQNIDIYGNYSEPNHYFIVMRNGKPSLNKGSLILNPDGSTKETFDLTVDRHQDGEADVYYKRNKYPLEVYYSNQETEPGDQKEIYYQAPILDVLAALDMQAAKPDSIPTDYEFKGWYLDSGYSLVVPDGATSAGQKSATTQAVYAKWGPPEGDIEVTIDPDNGKGTTTLTKAYGELIANSELGTPTRAGYRFLGWYRLQENGDLGDLYDFSYRVKAPFTIKAKWEKNQLADLTVRFVDEADQDLKETVTVKDCKVGSDYSYRAVLVDGMLPDKISKKITVTADSSKNILTFVYKPFETVDYQMRFVTRSLNAAGSLVEEEIQEPETVTTNKNIDTRNFKEIAGYTPLTLQQTLQLSQDPADNVMTFVYKKSEPGQEGYRVDYYFEQSDGSYQLDPDRTLQLSGTLGDHVSLGEDLSPEQLDGFSLNKEKSQTSGVVTSFGSLVLKLYYDSNQPKYVSITFDPNGGLINGQVKPVTMKYSVGEVITIPAAPTREGWEFLYWKGSEYQPGDQYQVVADHTFTAIWKKKPTTTSSTSQPGTSAQPSQTSQSGSSNQASPTNQGSGATTQKAGTQGEVPRTGEGSFVAYILLLILSAFALIVERKRRA